MCWQVKGWIVQVLCSCVLLSGCGAVRPEAPPGTAYIDKAQVPSSVDTREVDDGVVSPPPVGPGAQKPTVLDSVGAIVDRAQQGATEQFGAFMFQLDDFFAGDQVSDEPNTSFMRIRADAARNSDGDFELDPTVKLRVVLPRAEQRFRLLLSTEDDEDSGSNEVERIVGDDDQSLSFALRFARRLAGAVDVDFDVGARQRESALQIFGRINAQYRKQLTDRWQMRLGNRYYYYSRSGYEDRVRIDLTRQFGPLDDPQTRFFRSSTTIDWRATRNGAVINQTLGVYLDLGLKTALAIEAIGKYVTELDEGVSDRYRGAEFRLRYRKNVWRPWLFVELWPGIAWPAEREYRRTFVGLARVEVTIGGDDLAAMQNRNP